LERRPLLACRGERSRGTTAKQGRPHKAILLHLRRAADAGDCVSPGDNLGRAADDIYCGRLLRLPSDRARWHAELGDLDAAFEDLDDSLTQRELRLPHVTYFADFAPLWKDPRFDDLLRRIGVK
jgi:hypothetical protein